MSRKIPAVLIVWLLLAIACGSDEPTSGPVSTPAISEEPTTTGTVDTAAPATTSAPVTVEEGTTTRPIEETSETTSITTVATTEDPPTENTATTTTTVYSGPLSPITGQPVPDGNLVDRKLLAVKIDNHPKAQPQSGLEQADAVYELMVEGGFTRFIALFHHSDSEWVGPMRSARPTDWTLVQPLKGALLISGGQPWITRRIVNNNVPLIGDSGPPLTARWDRRSAPHNLYVDTYQGRRVASERGLSQAPPPVLFDRGPLNGPEGAAATYIFFDWSPTVDVAWHWNGEQYMRLAGGVAHEWRSREGDRTGQISADVLVVLMAERYTACPQGEGSCVPAWDTVGENRAIIFAEGSYSEGRWSRERAADWFTITDRQGNRISVPPGKPWIMIYPDTADVIW